MQGMLNERCESVYGVLLPGTNSHFHLEMCMHVCLDLPIIHVIDFQTACIITMISHIAYHLFRQRLAQLDKELDIRLSSDGRSSPSNAVGTAILPDIKEKGEVISAAATPVRAPGRTKIPSAIETSSNRAPQLPPPAVNPSELDHRHAQFETTVRSDGGRGSLLDASALSLQLPVQQAHSVHPNLKGGPRLSESTGVGPGEPASLDSVVVLDDVAAGKVEGEQFMAPFQVHTSNDEIPVVAAVMYFHNSILAHSLHSALTYVVTIPSVHCF
jgi:hypothetical protein